MAITSVNPAMGETIEAYDTLSTRELSEAIESSSEAFELWRRTSFGERAAALRRVASILRERADELARLMALEMGKPITGGRAECEKCAWVCDYYAEHAERFLAPEPRHRSSVCNSTTRRP